MKKYTLINKKMEEIKYHISHQRFQWLSDVPKRIAILQPQIMEEYISGLISRK
jgi:hypothetical protein